MNRFTWVAATISVFLVGCEPRRGGAARVLLIDLKTGRVSAIAVRETTVREYGSFLRWLDVGGGDHRFCHPDEPADKDHRPGLVRARYLEDPNAPVVGVDWFDAYAFCAWRGRHLPSRAQWLAAAAGPAEGWFARSVGADVVDLETGVSEWCDDDEEGADAPVCGGNRFLDERSARRVTRRSRLHRQASIGFRVAWRLGPRRARNRSR